MKKKSFFSIILFFGTSMLIIFVLTVSVLIQSIKKEEKPDPIIQTQYEYVYVPEEQRPDTDSQQPSEPIGWVLKIYAGQIGIFQMDGTLIGVIETYVKTLPKADQRLLEEGIYALTEQELRSLIEDYTD